MLKSDPQLEQQKQVASSESLWVDQTLCFHLLSGLIRLAKKLQGQMTEGLSVSVQMPHALHQSATALIR